MSYESAILAHRVLTELHIGILSLALLAALFCFVGARLGWRLADADAAFAGALFCGALFLAFSIGSGLLAWPWERLWRTRIVYGKAGFSALALALWSLLAYKRWQLGPALWASGRLAWGALGCAALAFAATAIAGSAGGHLGHGGSLLPVRWFGIDLLSPWLLPPWISLGLLAAALCLFPIALREGVKMTRRGILFALSVSASAALAARLLWPEVPLAQAPHGEHKRAPSPHHAPKPELAPAEGASVKILSPKPGEVFKGDQIPVRFKLVKGKRGEHVHAYVDGELMGMFKSESGTLAGIGPGKHTLELRVVAADHVTELDATDRVEFSVR